MNPPFFGVLEALSNFKQSLHFIPEKYFLWTQKITQIQVD